MIDIFVSPRADRMAKHMLPYRFLDFFRLFDLAHRCVDDASAMSDSAVYPLYLGSPYRLSPALARARNQKFNVYDAFDAAAARAVQARNGFFLLEISVESFFAHDDIVHALHEGISAQPLDPARVAVLNNNMKSATAYQDARRRLGLPDGPKVLPFHGCFWTLIGHNRGKSDAELGARVATAEATLRGARRSKKYLFLNARARPHRVHTILWLLDRKLLDCGLVTLVDAGAGTLEELWAVPGNRAPGPMPARPALVAKMAARSFPDAARLAGLMPSLSRLLPMSIDLARDSYTATLKNLLPWNSPDPAIYDAAYFSIVSDTSFVQDDWLFLSPIAFKSFMNFSPFLYFGNPGALAEMRQLGFQTFAPLIDERYDLEADHLRRMAALYAELERLLALPIEQLHELYCELWPRLSHNYWHLYRRAQTLFAQDFNTRVAALLGLKM